MLELHYDNPNLIDDQYDDSGFTVYATHTLRKHDLGLLTIGADASPASIQIPAQTKELTVEAYCHPDCSEVNVLNILFISHLKI